MNKRSKNVVINAQYRQPAGDFKQYKTYLEDFFSKMKKLFQKIFIPVINKPTRVSRYYATIQQ